MASSSKIIPLDYKDKRQVYAAAELHRTLLPDSPVPRLGIQFMAHFYYTKLVKDGLIKCDLYEHDEKYVAFLAYTKYPFTFMKEGKRRHPLYLPFLMSISLLCNPSRIRVILGATKMGRDRHLKENQVETGEMLSFGVLKMHSDLRDEITGLRVSNLLFENAIDYFKREGTVRIQAEVERDNKPSLLFWTTYGASIEDYAWGRGGNCLMTLDLSN